MSATNFDTSNYTYRKLMGNGLTYRIPQFQRDYSWTEDEWEDLWLDILGTIKDGGEPAHYMGYLVLQTDNDKVFDVIDGQQRLTTISLIVLAALKNLSRLIEDDKSPENNQQRSNQIRQTYIGYLDPITLVARSKLTLNRNNDRYFQTYIVPLVHLPQRGFRASEHSLRKAFEWFERRTRSYAQENAKHYGNDEGVALASLVETMSDRLFFTVITVTDELNAYKVFETLNARGVRLSATDLLKNHLFSVIHRSDQHEHEMKSLEDRWEALVGRLGNESFPDFLRTHWNSRYSFVRQSELFKTIRASLPDREAVFSLLREMEEDVDTYLALTHPESSHWPPTLKGHAQDLKMFGVRQPFPFLLSAKRYFTEENFESIIRACVIASFRYNVIGVLQANEQERVYNSLAEKITQNKLASVTDVILSLRPIYPTDDAFRSDFAEKIISTKATRNRRIVRYILCQIEKQLSGQDFDMESDSFNIEHVLPQNPSQDWNHFTDEAAELFVYRLGNLVLLRTSENRDIGNAAYQTKREAYLHSAFLVTQKLAEENLTEWTPERIINRQKWMANQATGIWRIPQLSQHKN
ncbi:MAG TPA: DUF262 domain-containing HNH endonuclease family protein [Blastocatellia bacterium]|nr:DUF262 domain-containing HNH endonuclease family protein [Blastocatellia bacterium]